nr:unnamed protein product [Spirometra erinaceieuropaei]
MSNACGTLIWPGQKLVPYHPPRARNGLYLTYIVLGVRSAGSHKKYTNLHPYTMSVGILAILVLRNSSGILRRYYSKFFLWVGRFALELFVLQYHMWITAPNGRGVITFIPTYTSLNFVLTTTLFFGCCWRVHEITQWLTSFLMP